MNIDSLYTLGPEVSCDIETSGIKVLETDILCIGFSDGVKTVIVWPYNHSLNSQISQFLKSRRRVIFHNASFDVVVMEAHGISFLDVNVEDTLLAHHAFASHFPQRLDHLVSEYCNSTAWKIKHGRRGGKKSQVHDMAVSNLCQYNAEDCKLTKLVWDRLQADLLPENQVYIHDKKLAEVCRGMIVSGIGIDIEKKEYLSSKMALKSFSLRESMRNMIGDREFQPSKLPSVRKVLFQSLSARVLHRTATGMPATSNETLEALKGDDTDVGRFCSLLLDWRVLVKARSTYVGGIRGTPLKFDEILSKSWDRAHYSWRPFGTVSGRLSCRLQSCPRWDSRDLSMRAREIYIPRKGHKFVYFDVSQAEMRLAAFLSGDSNFIEACNGDVHANNAKTVFPDIALKGWLDGDAKKDTTRGKPYRDISKNLGFAISYGAAEDKVFMTLQSKGFNITYQAVALILARLRAAYRTYYRFIESNVEFVRRNGYLRSPIVGRIRWFGRYPKPTEIANYPVQSALADIMNQRMIETSYYLPSNVSLVAQIHDACIYETPISECDRMKDIISEIWGKPISLLGGDMVLPIDLKRGECWSDL